MDIQQDQHRAVFAVACVVGISYLLVVGDDGSMAYTQWKGAGVALLALWCGLQARNVAGWMITAVIACGALGDVLLETHGLTIGALAFALGHLIAATLYWRNRQMQAPAIQKALALALLVLVPLVSWLLTASADVTFYAALLGTMAATAWLSRFPRHYTGIGAVMFVVSDWLIFARLGPLESAAWASYAIWLLYFVGQALIAWGVVITLANDKAG
jgi:uncharacterized membrane protein YhhN